MANRRKRLQRQADRKREQEQLDKLAQSLVAEGVCSTALNQPPSYITATSFMVSAAISGFDQDINFRSQLEWIKLRHREKEFERRFFATKVTAVDDCGLRQKIGEYPHPPSLNTDYIPDPQSYIVVLDKDGNVVPDAKVYPSDPIDRMLMESLNEPDVPDSDAGDDER